MNAVLLRALLHMLTKLPIQKVRFSVAIEGKADIRRVFVPGNPRQVRLILPLRDDALSAELTF